MLYNLTGATIEVILADRTRARIPVEELFAQMYAGATGGAHPGDTGVFALLDKTVTGDEFAADKVTEGVQGATDDKKPSETPTPVAKKVAAKTAGKKAGEGEAS